MTRYFLLFFFQFLILYSQDLPESYFFSQENFILNRDLSYVDDGFYSESTIDTIFLYFNQIDYWSQLQSNYCDKINIPATLIFNNEVYDSVGVRFKGQTSYFSTNGNQGNGPGGGGPGGGGPGNTVETDKKSFNIELDWIVDQDINGYETINLNNCFQDPSFLREFIYEKLIKKHIPAAKVNFVQLYINDENWGLYPNVQQLDKKHASEWFFDEECTRWRAEDPDNLAPGCGNLVPGSGPGSGPDFGAGESSLNYLGLDTTNYFGSYNLKKSYKNNPWQDLVDVCYAIENFENVDEEMIYTYINQFLDLDATLWYLASEIIFSDDDSYINKGGMDYFIYYDVFNSRMIPVEYDGNTVFNNPNWSPFYNEEDSDFVLMNKLFSIPSIRSRYIAHLKTLLNQNFNDNFINELIDNYSQMIYQHVMNDPKKIYSFQEFINEVQSIKNFFSLRFNFLINNDEISQQGCIIDNVTYYVSDSEFAQPTDDDNVVVNVQAENSCVDKLNIYVGTGLSGRFEKFQMVYDEQYSCFIFTIPAHNSGEYVRFYIESISTSEINTYSPQGAEHSVYIYQVKENPLTYSVSEIVINEIMASNDFTISDEYGEFDDWIEIYNKGNFAVNLSGYSLSDDINDLSKFTFPELLINPDEYLIVWADNDETQGNLHATFKLSASGEQLYLINNDLEIIDELIFGNQTTDMGLARIPNGVGDFVIQNPTFSMNNQMTTHLQSLNSSINSKYLLYDIVGRTINEPSNDLLKIIMYEDGRVEKFFFIDNLK